MKKSARGIIRIQTPLGGPFHIGLNASIQEKLGASGRITVIRGKARTQLFVELLSLEGDTGKEIRLSKAHARKLGLRNNQRVLASYFRRSKVLVLRKCIVKK
ncbi:hypothetical protein [Paenibacillus terrigena]|uniref:hypothetical protein n=1 Tax=Paenibacillus terrigena TaxID=369333 RepID=UPI0003774CDE|nr:hypothetical protein [Paenibacillus terrigena]